MSLLMLAAQRHVLEQIIPWPRSIFTADNVCQNQAPLLQASFSESVELYFSHSGLIQASQQHKCQNFRYES